MMPVFFGRRWERHRHYLLMEECLASSGAIIEVTLPRLVRYTHGILKAKRKEVDR